MEGGSSRQVLGVLVLLTQGTDTGCVAAPLTSSYNGRDRGERRSTFTDKPAVPTVSSTAKTVRSPAATRSSGVRPSCGERSTSRARSPQRALAYPATFARSRSESSLGGVGRISPLANPDSERRSTPIAPAISWRVNPEVSLIWSRRRTTSSARNDAGDTVLIGQAVVGAKMTATDRANPKWSVVPIHVGERPSNGLRNATTSSHERTGSAYPAASSSVLT